MFEEMLPSYDVFISHASEDKRDFVEPLAYALQTVGISVWYDDFSLKIGDSLSEAIDRGLANSLYGLVVLSPNFFKKKWPRRELGALIARQVNVLPIWHNITAEDVLMYSPLLADIVSVNSSQGMDFVIRRILEVVKPDLVRQKASTISALADFSALLRDNLNIYLRYSQRTNRDIKAQIEKVQEALVLLADIIDKVARASNPKDIWTSLEEAEKLFPSISMYCVKCRAIVKTRVGMGQVIMENGKPALSMQCPVCNTGTYKIGKAP